MFPPDSKVLVMLAVGDPHRCVVASEGEVRRAILKTGKTTDLGDAGLDRPVSVRWESQAYVVPRSAVQALHGKLVPNTAWVRADAGAQERLKEHAENAVVHVVATTDAWHWEATLAQGARFTTRDVRPEAVREAVSW